MDRQRFGYCGHENKNINMQSIKIGKSFFYNPAAAWFPRPQASHRVPFVWNFASDALEIMNIECLAFMIRPNFKRLQKSLKSQVNWSYQLENLIQKWMRRSEHSYFQKCHRLSKVPRRDISQLTTGQTFRNVKLIRIFFQRFFFAPSVWRPSTLYWCNGQRSNATRLLWLLSLLSTQVQPNQSTAKCKFWILSDKDKIVNMNSLSSKIHKGKKHTDLFWTFFLSSEV